MQIDHRPEILWCFCPVCLVARVELVPKCVHARIKSNHDSSMWVAAVCPRLQHLNRVGFIRVVLRKYINCKGMLQDYYYLVLFGGYPSYMTFIAHQAMRDEIRLLRHWCWYVFICMYDHHVQQTGHQSDMVANPVLLVIFPCPCLRLRI